MTEPTSIDLRDPAAVCAAVGIVEMPEIWRNTWTQSARSFVLGGVFFLDPEWVARTCQTLRFRDEVCEALQHAAAQVAAKPHLQRLLWHCHWLICLSGLDPQVTTWPEFIADPEPAGPMLYGVLTLSGFDHMRAMHAARGIDLEDTTESLASLETWLLDYRRRQGFWRFPRMGWLQHHLRGHLHKLGRLEFLPGSYHCPFRWYRHSETNRVVALAEDGSLFRPDGQFASADHGEVREGLWKSRFEETLSQVTGHLASPWGHVLPETVILDTAEWHEILRKGDPVVTVHIPAQGRLEPEECGASFRKAVGFYERHFPELNWWAFTCGSWLLDPQFELLDPPPPNLTAFLGEWYLHPYEGANDRGTWERVFDLFGGSEPDWEHAPQTTTLQRAVAAFTKQGGHLRGSMGVIFPEDLDWGKQAYRGRWPHNE